MPVSEAWVDFIAGWASGAMGVLTCQPVDTILTRVQAGQALVVGDASSNVAIQTRGLVSKFGVQSLWRGSAAMISAVPMQNALLMGGYGVGKQWATDQALSDDATSESANFSHLLLSVFVGGCTGGVVQSFFMSPIELMKVNQQVHATKTAQTAGSELLHGWHSTSWRGLNATLLRDGVPHGVWFASYEWCKTSLTGHSSIKGNRMGEQVFVPIVSGAVAATIAWAVGYPFDLIKTRIQATTREKHAKGMYVTAIELIQESNGKVISGLYRGFGLKLARAVPASMIGFLTYETVAGTIRGS